MNKHTPSEWKIETRTVHGPDQGDINVGYNIVVREPKKIFQVICRLPDGTEERHRANARLIAAAPRMYELLVEARKIVRDMPPDWNYQWDVLAMAIRNLLDEIDGQEDSHE